MATTPLSSSQRTIPATSLNVPVLHSDRPNAAVIIPKDTLESQNLTSSSESYCCLTFYLSQIARFFCWLFCCSRSSEHTASREVNQLKQDVAASVFRLVTSDMDESEKECISKAVTAVPIKKRDDIIEYALKEFIKPNMDGWERGGLIEALAALPLEERISIKDACSKLITSPGNGRLSSIEYLIKTVAAISPDQRKDVTRWVCRLMTPEMGDMEKVDIIETVTAVPTEKRNDVLEYALRKFIKPDMNLWEKRRIIEPLAALPVCERISLEEAFAKLVTPHMNGFVHTGTLIKTIVAIPLDERENVVAYALKLITPGMHGNDKRIIIETITAVPREKRDEVIGYVLDKFIKPEMSVWDRKDFIKTFADLLLPERVSMEDAFAKLSTPSDKGRVRGFGHLIKGIATVSLDQRENVVACVLRVITPDMDEVEKEYFIQTVKALPIEKRERIIQYALTNRITPDMDGYDRRRAIEAAATLFP